MSPKYPTAEEIRLRYDHGMRCLIGQVTFPKSEAFVYEAIIELDHTITLQEILDRFNWDKQGSHTRKGNHDPARR